MTPTAAGAETLTQKEASKRLGISAKQLRRLTKKHDAPRNDDGSYPWPEVVDWYKDFKQDEALRRRGINREAGEADYEQARAREKAAKADMAELELLERKGELIPVQVYKDELASVLTSVRSRLLNLPGRLGRELAPEMKPEEAEQIVEQGVREALEELQRAEFEEDR